MSVRILAIGKKHEAWVAEGIERYQKRLKKPFDVEWVLLPHSAKSGPEARQIESQALLSRITRGDFVVLLDETGKLYDSPALSEQLSSVFSRSANITLIIGGAYGVDNTLQARAQVVWSLSPLVFPHQLVRRFQPGVSVYFPESSGEAIVDILGTRLPMQPLKLDAFDKIVRALRI